MFLKYKYSFSIAIAFLFFATNLLAQTYIPISVSGFNQDLIANGSGGSNRAAATTTTTFDNVNAGGDNVMYSKDFRGNNNTNTAPPFGLPVNRIINSANLIGANYLLEPYDQNNALVLKTNGSSGTLTLGTPGVFSKIAFLGSSAESASTFSVVLNFSDGTNSTTNFNVPDWYNGPSFAIKGIGRVTRTVIGMQVADFFTGDSENPRLYDNQITLAAPFNTKVLTSITFNKTSATGNTAILAINGITPINAPVAPVATAATNVTFPSFTANWQAASGATAYSLDVSTSPTFSTLLPNYNNRNVGNVLSFNITGLVSSQNYYYRVRASNVSGVSPSSNTITIPFAQCPAGDYTAMTQADIDNFKILYPNCSKISGTLQIQNSTNIINVNGFNNIDTITLGLRIINNSGLINLDGFKKLKFVGGNFFISSNSKITIINSFDNLVSVGDFQIGSNTILSNVSGFGKIQRISSFNILDNPELKTFSCFDKISKPFIQFKNNAKLTDIQSIGIIDSITDINIDNNSSLTNLTALKSVKYIGAINIRTNPALKNLNDLSTVANVNGKIEINNNSTLNDISGLNNINPVSIKGSGLIITNNNLLSVCNLPNFCTYLQGTGARNISGNAGNCLNEQAVLNICNAVSAPVALPATNVTSTTFTANWQAVNGASSYFIDATTDPTFTTIELNNSPAGNTLSIALSMASPNTTYYYRVRAYNGFSTSPNSNVISVTTLNVAPSAPTALAATNIASTSFTANWQSNANTTGYLLDVSTNSNFSSFVSGYNNLSVGNVQSRSITGLTLNTTYYYRIRANNAVGTSPNSNVISVITSNVAPSAPTATAATNITSTGFTANWNVVGNATGYFIDVSTNSNFSSFVTGYNNLSVGNVQNRSITGLVLNTTYYYRIRANNAVGTSPNSNVITVITSNGTPVAPTAIAATNITSTGFTANWNVIGNATGYFIDVSTNSNFSSFVTGYNNLSVGNVQNQSITGLILNTTYYYRIRANNAVGTSPNSNVIQLTTLDNTIAGKPIALTGFNFDIIANGIGGGNRAQNSTNIDFEWVLYSKDFRGNNNILSAPKYGLPDDGKIVNVNLPGYDYQLANYTGNNALILKNINESGTLSLVSQDTISEFSVLAAGGGTSTINAIANFSDGTNSPFTFSVASWTGNNPDFAIKGLGWVRRKNDQFDENQTDEYPRLYNHKVSLPVPFINKRLVSITFSKTSTNEFLAILAITGIVRKTGQDCKVTIPDTRFKSYLVGNTLINTNRDNEIQCDEAINYSGEINCSNLQINDLSGIESFINVTSLKCNNNQLNDLDIQYNIKLHSIWCNNNKLNYLNVSNNNNRNMKLIEAFNNPDLTCVQVDDESYSKTNWIAGSSFKFDPQHVFSNECDPCRGTAEEIEGNFLISASGCIGDSIRIIDYSKFDENFQASFIWNFGDGGGSQERDPIYVYSNAGNYTIQLIASTPKCKSMIIKKEISIGTCAGLEELSINTGILFPNPNNGNIIIKAKLAEPSETLLKVYNLQGHIVKEIRYAETKWFEEKFELEESGIYLIDLIHNSGSISFKTLVCK